MDVFGELETCLKKYLPHEDIEQIHEAYLFAKKAHQGQKRLSGEDYITHPVDVAKILAKLHMDRETIAAALLHDVIEDTFCDKKTLQKKIWVRSCRVS